MEQNEFEISGIIMTIPENGIDKIPLDKDLNVLFSLKDKYNMMALYSKRNGEPAKIFIGEVVGDDVQNLRMLDEKEVFSKYNNETDRNLFCQLIHDLEHQNPCSVIKNNVLCQQIESTVKWQVIHSSQGTEAKVFVESIKKKFML